MYILYWNIFYNLFCVVDSSWALLLGGNACSLLVGNTIPYGNPEIDVLIMDGTIIFLSVYKLMGRMMSGVLIVRWSRLTEECFLCLVTAFLLQEF